MTRRRPAAGRTLESVTSIGEMDRSAPRRSEFVACAVGRLRSEPLHRVRSRDRRGWQRSSESFIDIVRMAHRFPRQPGPKGSDKGIARARRIHYPAL